MKDIERILVVSRMTQYCRKVIHFGVSLAQQYGAELFVIHVVHDPFGLDGWSIPNPSLHLEFQNLLHETKKELDRIIREENRKGMNIKELIREGEPTKVIADVVKEYRIDLMLVLAHEEGRLEHFLFGRSNEKLVRTMPCSILLVKQELEAVSDEETQENQDAEARS